jgi:hypothetical protein
MAKPLTDNTGSAILLRPPSHRISGLGYAGQAGCLGLLEGVGLFQKALKFMPATSIG